MPGRVMFILNEDRQELGDPRTIKINWVWPFGGQGVQI